MVLEGDNQLTSSVATTIVYQDAVGVVILLVISYIQVYGICTCRSCHTISDILHTCLWNMYL